MQGLMSEKSKLFKDYSVYDDNNGYFLLSGTSQATAVTTGIVALMLQDQPHLSPDDVKCRLIDSARMAQTESGNLGYSIFRQGAGMVDAYEAVMSQASNCANLGMDIKKSLQAEEFYAGPARWNQETEEYYVESHEGFEWIDHGDHQNSVMSYIRKGNDEKDNVVIVLNLTPVPRENYRIGLPKNGALKVIFNSDVTKYNGTGNFKNTKLVSEKKEWNNRENSIELNLPPLGMLAFKYK